MTRDEILSMPAGQKMDALVAEKVMGYERRDCKLDGEHDYPCITKDGWLIPICQPGQFGNWSPSTDIAAAWEVVEKMRGELDEIVLDRDGDWRCYFIVNNVEFFAYAKEAPLAICRAALLAGME